MKLVILAAGFGSRLWPLSTSDKPKQFQQILGQQTPIQYTYELLSKAAGPSNIYVLTLAGLEPLLLDQVPSLEAQHIISVPERRNTLPHTLFALHEIAESDNEFIHFFSVDHVLEDPGLYVKSLQAYLKKAPTDNPENIYLHYIPTSTYNANNGYAHLDENRRVTDYTEKPTQDAWNQLMANGPLYDYTAVYSMTIKATRKALLDLDAPLGKMLDALLLSDTGNFIPNYLSLPFADIESHLFQCAINLYGNILEHAQYTDIGTYGALYKLNDKNSHQNVIIGNVVLDDVSTGNIIINTTPEPLAVINTHDSAVIRSAEGSLQTPLSNANNIGEIYKTRIHQH